mgnify:FL=1
MVLPLIAVEFGGVAVAGVTLAVVASIDPDETINDKIEKTLIRTGYITEGMVKGAIVAVPTSALVLIAFNVAMNTKDKVI